jgi:hypothetical protein
MGIPYWTCPECGSHLDPGESCEECGKARKEDAKKDTLPAPRR